MRTAASVFFALLAVAFLILWVRSYHFADTLCRPALISSEQGDVNLFWDGDIAEINQWMHSRLVVPWNPSNKEYLPPATPRFGWNCSHNRFYVHFPHWSVVLAAIGLAAIPWIRVRFSVRTLLCTTTGLATLMGFVAWMVR
jgi:hypothetical protein